MADHGLYCKICNDPVVNMTAYEFGYYSGFGLSRVQFQHIYTSRSIDNFCHKCIKYLDKMFINTGSHKVEKFLQDLFSNQEITREKNPKEPICSCCNKEVSGDYYAVLFYETDYKYNEENDSLGLNTKRTYFINAFCTPCHWEMQSNINNKPYIEYTYLKNKFKSGSEKSLRYPFSLNYETYEQIFKI